MSAWKCKTCGGTYNDRGRDGSTYMHACSPSPPDEHGSQKELPNKRDETIAFDSRGIAKGIVSAGAGVSPVGGQASLEPEWITALREEYERT